MKRKGDTWCSTVKGVSSHVKLQSLTGLRTLDRRDCAICMVCDVDILGGKKENSKKSYCVQRKLHSCKEFRELHLRATPEWTQRLYYLGFVQYSSHKVRSAHYEI